MTSLVFDPFTGETETLDMLRDNKPFMRKVLKTTSCSTQMVEIKISQILLDNPHINIVKVFEIKLPTEYEDGYIDSELLEPLENNNGMISTSNIKRMNTLDENITKALEHLHDHWIVYIDLHTGNVGWSKEDRCWKIFDFNMSGIVKKDTNEWADEPSRGIYYNAMLEQGYVFEYDNIAVSLFEREKKRLLKKAMI